MAVRLNVFVNHMCMKLNGIGQMTDKLFWYARNAVKESEYSLIMIPLGRIFIMRINKTEKASIPVEVEKEIVTELEQIFRIVDDKPYFELKYKKVGEDYYHVGYSSFDFHNVLKWKEEYFELANCIECKSGQKDSEIKDEWQKEYLKEAWACDFCGKALEKQISKKVLYEDVGFDCQHDVNLYACICPSCGLHIIDFSDYDIDSKCNSDNPEDMFHSSMVYHAYIGINNYCNRCGQKLDWG